MQYQIYSKNVIVTDSLKEFIDTKMDKLEKFASHITSCHLDISRDSKHHSGEIFRFEMNVSIPQKLLRIERTHEDVRAAVDAALDAMAVQLTKAIERRRDRSRAPRIKE